MKKLAVVIPAYNEERHIDACIQAIQHAYEHLKRHTPRVNVPELLCVVVLDSCTDNTAEYLKAYDGVQTVVCAYQCVGRSRDDGIRHSIAQGADWICCTDADSTVSINWFSSMLLHQPIDLICGIVDLNHDQPLSALTQQKYRAHYQDQMGHRHIHGANLCFSSSLYLILGGFNAMSCHEDVDFVRRAARFDARIMWSNQLRVSTSSRLKSRIEQGFASFLASLERDANF